MESSSRAHGHNFRHNDNYRDRLVEIARRLKEANHPDLANIIESIPIHELKIRSGRAALCDHASKTITVTFGQCLCYQMQELIQEITNMSYCSVRENLENQGRQKRISRDHFITVVEFMEFQGVRNVVQAYDLLKNTDLFGCVSPIDKNARAREYVEKTKDISNMSIFDKHFEEYLKAVSRNHKENIGKMYDVLERRGN